MDMVEMGDGVRLVPDEVIQAIGGIGVDEAIADPFSGADADMLLDASSLG